MCCAHPRAHQRNHPPTIDYYLSNLHSNRALVQICTPCFDPFGNPLQILLRRCDSSSGIVSVTCSTFFFSLSHSLSLSLSLSSFSLSSSIEPSVFAFDRLSRRDGFSTFPANQSVCGFSERTTRSSDIPGDRSTRRPIGEER